MFSRSISLKHKRPKNVSKKPKSKRAIKTKGKNNINVALMSSSSEQNQTIVNNRKNLPMNLYGIVNKNQQSSEINRQMSNEITSDECPNDAKWAGLSDICLSDFTKKSALIQEHLARQNFDKDVICLPNIFYTESISTDRFKRFYHCNGQFVKMVNRKAIVDDIMAKACKYGRIQFNHIVYGPQGCGKSFVLYQLAATIMKDPAYFVVYINKVSSDRLFPDLVRILYAKLKSIGADVDRIFNILDAKYSIQSFIDDNSRSRYFIQIAINTLEEHKQRVVFIIDQVNEIREERITSYLLKSLKLSYDCIFGCCMTNYHNKIEYKAMDLMESDERENLVRFSIRDFRALCTIFKNQLPMFSEYEEENIMSITGAVANYLIEFLELNYLQQTRNINVEQAIKNYKNILINEKFSNDIFEQYTLTLNRTISAIEIIFDMLRGVSIGGNRSFDKRFLYLGPYFTPKPISMVAFTALVHYYSHVLETAKTYYGLNYYSSLCLTWFKGSEHNLHIYLYGHGIQIGSRSEYLSNLIKSYITQWLIVNAQATFPVHVLCKGKKVKPKTVTLEMCKLQVVFFDGQKAPPPQDFEQNTLFVPTNPNYPGYCLFYYDASLNRLYMIQATIFSSNSMDNDHKEEEMKVATSYWKDHFLPDQAEMVEILMVQNKTQFQTSTNDIERKKQLNVIFFDELEQMPDINWISY